MISSKILVILGASLHFVWGERWMEDAQSPKTVLDNKKNIANVPFIKMGHVAMGLLNECIQKIILSYKEGHGL